jgi:acetolactate synthase-1/2/3 large subunit
MAELETAVREDIPVVALIIDDSGFGSIRGHQAQRFPGRSIGATFSNPRFDRFAQDLGAFGARVETADKLEAALTTALASGKPAVIDAIISREDMPT